MNEHATTPKDAPEQTSASPSIGGRSAAGVALGALGVVAAVWAYWLVLPGIIFGIVAIALGVLARRQAHDEAGNVAIALGIVAVMLVPSVLIVVDGAEAWGRDCALHPTNPDC